MSFLYLYMCLFFTKFEISPRQYILFPHLLILFLILNVHTIHFFSVPKIYLKLFIYLIYFFPLSSSCWIISTINLQVPLFPPLFPLYFYAKQIDVEFKIIYYHSIIFFLVMTSLLIV